MHLFICVIALKPKMFFISLTVQYRSWMIISNISVSHAIHAFLRTGADHNITLHMKMEVSVHNAEGSF